MAIETETGAREHAERVVLFVSSYCIDHVQSLPLTRRHLRGRNPA